MSPIRALLVMFVLGTVALAGCISDDAPKTTDADDQNAADAHATETTGAISGEVASTSLESLKNAKVDLLRDDTPVAETTTDLDGEFTFNDLEPAKYIVQVSALLHKNMAKTVTVEAGKVAKVAMMLEPLEADGVFFKGDEYTGMMSFGAEARAHHVSEELAEADAPSGLSVTWGALDSSHAVNFPLPVEDTAALETLIVEVYWNNDAVGMRGNIWYNPNCSPCEPDIEYAQEGGFGEIKMRVDRPDEGWGLETERADLDIYMWPESTEEQPVVLAYQQAFTVYWEAWYREPAPEDRVIRADI